jgi:glycerophosphoryl diester phosphodiesterase
LFTGQVIAHRGASAYAPENTLVAFEKAKAMGATCIEFDVMLSEDGEAFIFHDETLNRTTNGAGRFGRVSAEYIRTLDAGSWFSSAFSGEKIPTLQAVLDWLSTRDMQANIEIKPFPGCTEETAWATLRHINLYWPHQKARPLVSSFDLEALRLCRQLEPELPLGLLLDQWREDALEILDELKCVSVHLNKRLVNLKRVQALKQAGYLIYVYTINRRKEAQKYMNLGVDAIFTNYPDLFEKKSWIKKIESPRIRRLLGFE